MWKPQKEWLHARTKGAVADGLAAPQLGLVVHKLQPLLLGVVTAVRQPPAAGGGGGGGGEEGEGGTFLRRPGTGSTSQPCRRQKAAQLANGDAAAGCTVCSAQPSTAAGLQVVHSGCSAIRRWPLLSVQRVPAGARQSFHSPAGPGQAWACPSTCAQLHACSDTHAAVNTCSSTHAPVHVQQRRWTQVLVAVPPVGGARGRPAGAAAAGGRHSEWRGGLAGWLAGWLGWVGDRAAAGGRDGKHC